MIDVMEYVCPSTLNITNLNTAQKRKCKSRLYHIVENNFAMENRLYRKSIPLSLNIVEVLSYKFLCELYE